MARLGRDRTDGRIVIAMVGVYATWLAQIPHTKRVWVACDAFASAARPLGRWNEAPWPYFPEYVRSKDCVETCSSQLRSAAVIRLVVGNRDSGWLEVAGVVSLYLHLGLSTPLELLTIEVEWEAEPPATAWHLLDRDDATLLAGAWDDLVSGEPERVQSLYARRNDHPWLAAIWQAAARDCLLLDFGLSWHALSVLDSLREGQTLSHAACKINGRTAAQFIFPPWDMSRFAVQGLVWGIEADYHTFEHGGKYGPTRVGLTPAGLAIADGHQRANADGTWFAGHQYRTGELGPHIDGEGRLCWVEVH